MMLQLPREILCKIIFRNQNITEIKKNVTSDATGEICHQKHEVVVKPAAAGEGSKELRMQRTAFLSEPSRKP